MDGFLARVGAMSNLDLVSEDPGRLGEYELGEDVATRVVVVGASAPDPEVEGGAAPASNELPPAADELLPAASAVSRSRLRGQGAGLLPDVRLPTSVRALLPRVGSHVASVGDVSAAA